MFRHISIGPSKRPLAFAFGVSLILHLVLFVLSDVLGRFDLFAGSALSQAVREQLEADQAASEAVELAFEIEPEMMPTQFVDAAPEQATEEKPEETPYYSVIDAVAGDDSPDDSQVQPEIDGEQDKVLKTMDTAPDQVALPTVAAAPEAPQPEEALETSEVEQETDLTNPAMSEDEVLDAEGEDDQMIVEGESEAPAEELATLRPSQRALEAIDFRDSKIVEPAPPQRPRPRTLAEARRQQGLVGQRMKQEGGAPRFRLQSTPDLMSTPFADYDARVIQAIQQRWFDLLGALPTARNARGRVVLEFYMHSDGSVKEVEVVEDSVGVIQSLVCQKAVSEPAPYGRWPDDMRRLIGDDRREVRFSFFYN